MLDLARKGDVPKGAATPFGNARINHLPFISFQQMYRHAALAYIKCIPCCPEKYVIIN